MSSPVPDPLEALRRLAFHWRPRRPERTPVERALGRFLASPLEVPLRRGPARAAVNGFALPSGTRAGEYVFRSRTADLPPADGRAGEEVSPPLELVETGDPLPPGTARVVPVEWTEIAAAPGQGPARVRIAEDALPPDGHGLSPPEEEALVLARGTRIDARLEAVLLARGVSAVETFPPERVGLLTIGRELTDVLGGEEGQSERDLTGYWLPACVRALGHTPCALGIVGDGLAEGRAALLRARQKKVATVILSGGLGDGVSDRTLELLLRAGARVHFERVAISPGRRCLAAEWMGIRLLALGGQPLEAAAGFDLFARPALLVALGAPPSLWDWSERELPPEWLLGGGEGAAGGETAGWIRRARRDGASGVELWEALAVRPHPRQAALLAIGPPSPFLPWVAAQSGWAVLPPRERQAPREGPRLPESRRFYFQPTPGPSAFFPGPWGEARGPCAPPPGAPEDAGGEAEDQEQPGPPPGKSP